MSKTNRRFNWKARRQQEVSIDNSEVSKIKLLIDGNNGKYDASNELVLPSKKRKTKKLNSNNKTTKLLSKKQRKKLEKILEKKKKKVEGAEILEALQKVQAAPEELDQLTSIAIAQTRGRKRQFEWEPIKHDITVPSERSEGINSLSGTSKRQKRILAAILNKDKPTETRDDFVGLDEVDSDSSDEELAVDIPKKEVVEQEEEIIINNVENEAGKSEEQCPVSIVKVEQTEPFVQDKVPIKKAVWVPVDRRPDVQEARLKLPILAEEQGIMETITEHDVVIIAGETGSGKTTQLPQFLYEAGYTKEGKMVGITQPRRVAAIAMSKRVADEMNLDTEIVSYLIRFEGNVSSKTQIKFMTDGVLLKEMQTDFLLSNYSAIILDEAHERNTYTDILIGLLSRLVPLRRKRNNPLKLIIMSATLRVEDFTDNIRLFKTPPPVVKVESRQYPVSVHFSKRTEQNYLKEAFNKVSKIHARLPEGSILVFLTGQQEVNTLVRRLRNAFPFTKSVDDEDQDDAGYMKKKTSRRKPASIKLPEIDLDKYSVVPTDDAEGDELEEDLSEDEVDLADSDFPTTAEPLWVLPFYSLLPASKQAKVFQKPPTGCRLCVVSTNVAETSLTIPNVKYVVDSGRTKTRLYDKLTGVSTFQVAWCSKSSSNQRAGRAGRVAPGHCYRLFSSAVFNDLFEQFAPPEILQKPVDSLVLQMKAMNIVKVVNFPFPTPPDLLHLRVTEKKLQILEALEKPSKNEEWSSRLTKLGETMSIFPVAPRFAKMLALSCQHDLLQYVLCIVAALSVPEVLVENDGDRKWAVMRRSWAGVGNSFLLGDVMVLLRAVGAAECSKESLELFCEKNGLRHKAIVEIRKLRVQLTNQLNLHVPNLNLIVDPDMRPPTDTQARLLRQIVLTGMSDQVAHKVDLSEIKNNEDKVKMKRAYKCAEMEEPVFMRASSVLCKDLPEWVVYQEVYETGKLYMRGVTAIEPEWLPIFAKNLCNLSKPMEDPPPRFDQQTGKVYCTVSGTFGKAAFPLPNTEVAYTETMSSYRWFAKFLLEGEIFPKLRRFTPNLLSSPSSMIKSWSKLQPRTETILNALVSQEAITKQKLLDIWAKNPMYLLSAYEAWLPSSAHGNLASMWPPI